MVSDAVEHGKYISEAVFKIHYLRHVKSAIERSKSFTTDVKLLINSIGTSIGEFFEEIML